MDQSKPLLFSFSTRLAPADILNIALLVLTLSLPLSAQENQSSSLPPAHFENVEVRSPNDRETALLVHFRSSLPGGTRLKFSIKNQVEHSLVDRKTITIENSGQNTMVFGPYDSLWKSTYEIEAELDPAAQNGRQINMEKYDYISRYAFQVGSNLLPPRFQKAQFRKTVQDIGKQYRRLFLSSYSKIRELHTRKSREDSPPAESEFRSLVQRIQSKLEQIHDQRQTLQTAHPRGAPFQIPLKKLRTLQIRAVRFFQTALSGLHESHSSVLDFSSTTPNSNSDQRDSSLKQLRIRFLNQLISLLNQQNQQTRREWQNLRIGIRQRLRKLITLYPDGSNNNPEGSGETAETLRQSIQDLKSFADQNIPFIDKRLWLYRGTNFENAGEDSPFREGIELKRLLFRLKNLPKRPQNNKESGDGSKSFAERIRHLLTETEHTMVLRSPHILHLALVDLNELLDLSQAEAPNQQSSSLTYDWSTARTFLRRNGTQWTKKWHGLLKTFDNSFSEMPSVSVEKPSEAEENNKDGLHALVKQINAHLNTVGSSFKRIRSLHKTFTSLLDETEENGRSSIPSEKIQEEIRPGIRDLQRNVRALKRKIQSAKRQDE